MKNLSNLSHLLKRAEVHAKESGFPIEVLLTSRLYPDMFDCTRQVQIATDISRRGVARLAGCEAPVMDDNKTTSKSGWLVPRTGARGRRQTSSA